MHIGAHRFGVSPPLEPRRKGNAETLKRGFDMMSWELIRQHFTKTPKLTRALALYPLCAFVIGALGLKTAENIFAPLLSLFPFTPDVLSSGEFWRFFTHPFHFNVSDPIHVIFEGLIMFWFGSELERFWGTTRFAFALIFATISASLLSLIVTLAGGPVAGGGYYVFTYMMLFSWAFIYKTREFRFWGIIPLTGASIAWIAGVFLLLQTIAANSYPWTLSVGGALVGFCLTNERVVNRVRTIFRRRASNRAHHSGIGSGDNPGNGRLRHDNIGDFRVIDGGLFKVDGPKGKDGDDIAH